MRSMHACSLVINGANILGVTVVQALEAYGGYFVNYVSLRMAWPSRGSSCMML